MQSKTFAESVKRTRRPARCTIQGSVEQYGGYIGYYILVKGGVT